MCKAFADLSGCTNSICWFCAKHTSLSFSFNRNNAAAGENMAGAQRFVCLHKVFTPLLYNFSLRCASVQIKHFGVLKHGTNKTNLYTCTENYPCSCAVFQSPLHEKTCLQFEKIRIYGIIETTNITRWKDAGVISSNA